jgi:hypothetical protein
MARTIYGLWSLTVWFNTPTLAARGKPKKRWAWILTAAGAALLAVITAFASGFGSKLADSVSSGDSPLVSYSTELLAGKCRGGEFVPRSSLPAVLGPGGEYDWEALERQPGAAQANVNPVQVSIQGESARTITLTRVEFHVTRHRRPRGGAFSGQCGDAYRGRALEVDLDSSPPRIVDSNLDEQGVLGSRNLQGERMYRPIRFPWTVSVTDPLLLEILATTDSCYCTWSAAIPWVSGGSRGTIAIDNDGDGYTVAGTAGLPIYTPSVNGWRRYQPSR